MNFLNSYKYRYNAAKFYFKTFLSEEAEAFGNNRKGTSKITAKNKKKLDKQNLYDLYMSTQYFKYIHIYVYTKSFLYVYIHIIFCIDTYISYIYKMCMS